MTVYIIGALNDRESAVVRMYMYEGFAVRARSRFQNIRFPRFLFSLLFLGSRVYLSGAMDKIKNALQRRHDARWCYYHSMQTLTIIFEPARAVVLYIQAEFFH